MAIGVIWADIWDEAIWDNTIWAQEVVLTPPTMLTAVVPGGGGTSLVLTFSEPCTIGAGGSGGFAVNMSGGAATLTYASGSGSSAWTYTVSRSVGGSETGTIDYTQPGNGVEDAAGDDLASFTGATVTVAAAAVDVDNASWGTRLGFLRRF